MTAGVAGMVADDDIGRTPRPGEFEGEAVGHGSSRGGVCSNAETKPRGMASAGVAEAIRNVDGDHPGRRWTSGEGGFGYEREQ